MKHSSVASRLGGALMRLATFLVSIEEAPTERTRTDDDIGINPVSGLSHFHGRAGMDIAGNYKTSPPRIQIR